MTEEKIISKLSYVWWEMRQVHRKARLWRDSFRVIKSLEKKMSKISIELYRRNKIFLILISFFLFFFIVNLRFTLNDLLYIIFANYL